MNGYKMRNTLYLLALTLATFACGPKNEEITDEQVDVAPMADALDTIASTEKDGLKTDNTEKNITLPMPQPVMQLLTQRYPGWEQPQLTAEAQEKAKEFIQGPTVVHGDFNGDLKQDLALQFQLGDNLVIVAAMQQQDEVYKFYELKQDILFNERGTLKSLYYLYVVEKGEKLRNTKANEEKEAPYEAVAVGFEGDATVYLYENGAFTAYSRRN